MSTTSPPGPAPVWTDGPDGYSLALDGTALVCRNAKGRLLRSVPKKVRESAEAERLTHVLRWLERHERECAERVESWLLGSLPVPAELIARVWPDPSWSALLTDLYVVPAGGGEGGFLRGVDGRGRVGVVDLDAESTWLDADRVVPAHPVLIEDLDDVREFALELGITQRLPQLTRQIHRRPDTADPAATSVEDYSGGEFDQLNHAVGRARRYGYSVRGGYAVCRVVEQGRQVQARYWIGADAPDYPAWTGPLLWVDADERPLRLGDVGPVAWSEGVRMAELVHAGRKNTEEEQER
ncbi:DUF4132 domain-containing protein [Nocardiopsis aegyptia]|uniref:DUF4132 domain-containing protein n=1 Tax=Nocardiopsis aegyptia TaxID=220378 RepID=UPI00366A866A